MAVIEPMVIKIGDKQMFTWVGGYGDREQVQPFLADYSKLREAGMSYNDDFKGQIPGLEGSLDEDRAIYALSCLWHIEQEQKQIAAALADGYTVMDIAKPATQQRFPNIIVYRPEHYSGGTGLISRYTDARLIFDDNGQPSVLLPKGRRTRGYDVRRAQILVKQM